jgi:hypothetical protein
LALAVWGNAAGITFRCIIFVRAKGVGGADSWEPVGGLDDEDPVSLEGEGVSWQKDVAMPSRRQKQIEMTSRNILCGRQSN